MQNIKKISKKLVETSAEVSINLQKLVEMVKISKESNEEKIEIWVKDMLNFIIEFKSHIREGFGVLIHELDIDAFNFKKINIKKKSEINEITNILKNFLTSSTSTKKQEKKLSGNEVYSKLNIKVKKIIYFFLGSNRFKPR